MADLSPQDLAIQARALEVLRTMESNPAAKAHLERALKAVNPELQTEEDVAARITAPVQEQVAQLSTQLSEFLAAQKAEREAAAEAALTTNLETAFGNLRKQGYTEEGIERVKGLMVERKVGDVESAVALFEKQNPPAPPEQPGYTPHTWDIGAQATGGADDLKLLFGNEDAWADKKTAEVLNEIRIGKAN